MKTVGGSKPVAAAARKAAASAGYSGTPLPKKIGLQEGGTLVLVDAPKGAAALFEPLPDRARLDTDLGAGCALAILFCADATALRKRFAKAAARMAEDGALWIAWPKKASLLFRDLTEDGIREEVLPSGWVDVKVCAIDADWSGLKLMKRRELRGKPTRTASA
ncbi:MAG: DUF3052 domain-containing protein [Betaproteobacteria bacterium]|nr:DUF3052 domain-containing protein [Betaproteobacteria bacterium]